MTGIRSKASLLKRIRWLDMVPEAKAFTAAMLGPGELGNFDVLNTDQSAEALDRLVHVVTDLVMLTIDRVFGGLSVDELAGVDKGRRHLVWALEKLVFRNETLERAARLLRGLGAAETETRITNNAAGQFKGLYHLYLSGTKAEPESRLKILDEGLRSTNAKERELCVEALDAMLQTGHFSRGEAPKRLAAPHPWKIGSPRPMAISRISSGPLSAVK